MFLNDTKPILHTEPADCQKIEMYFVHDLHFGSAQFNAGKWEKLSKQIESSPQARLCWIGDLMENAIPGGKSNVFDQKFSPSEQLEWVTEQLKKFADKTIAVVPGNHEHNRTTKTAGLYPIYDACVMAGIQNKYRDTFAIIDIGIGSTIKNRKKQYHYIGQIQHKARDTKYYNSSDYTDGIDWFAYGHDHDPHDHPRAKMVYDTKNKTIYKRNIEVVDCRSCLNFGGYGSKEAYRPQSDKMYTLTLLGQERGMETRGFYL